MHAGNLSENLRTEAGTALAAPHGPIIADPVPVGIVGFAMTTFILSCVDAGFFGGTAVPQMGSSASPSATAASGNCRPA
ncbi:MAG: GPR1/FUN34/YaaH family transporter [Streptosporangiaceae bacterium]|jgi:succinate-acetate transporter protein